MLASSTNAISVIPALTASSTAYWTNGVDSTGSNALGTRLVTGKKRVPRPATGITALRTGTVSELPIGR